MSVSHTGPAGYDFQYEVTVWLTLLFWSPRSVFVENGLEDASLELIVESSGGEPLPVELQVKAEKGQIDPARLAARIAHFPARRAQGCLLEWLQEEAWRCALLVEGGRAEDRLSGLLWRPGGSVPLQPRKRPVLTQQQARALRDGLAGCYRRPKGKLDAARQQRCIELAREISLAEWRQLSRRIFLVDQRTRQDIQEEAETRLYRQFRVPQSQTGSVFRALVDLVRKARDHGKDLVSSFRNLLVPYLSTQIFVSQVHVNRGAEDLFADELRREGVLLLTGSTFCGKTHMGRTLAQRLQDEGFFVRETPDIGEARRFLTDPTTPEDRLILLEDPFGKLIVGQDAIERLEALSSLVGDLRAHRKLIVTSRRDILQPLITAGVQNINGYSWHDLTLRDPLQAIAIWRAYSKFRSVDPETSEMIIEGLLQMETGHLLQAGQLQYLANLPAQELTGRSFNELVTVARHDVVHLGAKLCSRSEMQEVLATFALTASTITSVPMAELTYILTDGGELPGRLDRGDELTYGGEIEEELAFPSYSPFPPLSPAVQEAIDELELRGLLEHHARRYRFSHPSYEQAAAMAFNRPTNLQHTRLMLLARRALFCLAPVTARLAAEALHRLRRQESDPERRQEITDLLLNGLASIFPVVGDRNLVLFLEDFEALDSATRKQILIVIERRQQRRAEIRWHAGEGWYEPRKIVPLREWFAAEDEEAFNRVRASFNALSDKNRLAPEEMWLLLRSHSSRKDLVEERVLAHALRYDEAIIRGEAAKLLMRDHSTELPHFVQAVVNDPDPLVVADAVRGFLRGWGNQAKLEYDLTLNFLLPAVEHASRAVLIIPLLTHIDEVTQRFQGDLPWEIWASLVSAVLWVVPADSLINEGRLYKVFEEAVPNIPQALALKVLEAWTDWVERSLKVRVPDDYGLAIAELMLVSTEQDSKVREELFCRLLSQSDTYFIATTLSDLFVGWKNLDGTERQSVLEVLRKPRLDQRWLRAAALTVISPPGEIVEELLGNRDALKGSGPDLIARFPEGLLHACLLLRVGLPIQLLHRGKEPWDSLLLWIAQDPSHRLFDMAVGELLGRFAKEERGLKVWERLSGRADEKTAQSLFSHLLRRTKEITEASLSDHWRILWAAPSAQRLRGEWLDHLIAAIEVIEHNDNLGLFLTLSGFQNTLFNRFSSDRKLLQLLRSREEQDLTPQTREQILLLYDQDPPQLLMVHNVVLNALGGDRDSKEPLMQKVRQARHAWLEENRGNRPFRDANDEVDDWVWSFQTS